MSKRNELATRIGKHSSRSHTSSKTSAKRRPKSAELRNAHPEIDWVEMIGMRHRIVRDSINVDTERVSAVLQHEIPRLIEQLLAFTPPEPPSA